MISDTNLNKLESFFSKDSLQELSKLTVIKKENSIYVLFDTYCIVKDIGRYKLSMKQYHGDKIFYTLKNAVMYATLHFKNRINESNRIVELDQKIENIDFSIFNLKSKIKSSSNTDNTLIYSSKLSQDYVKKQNLLKEFQIYERLARSYQNNIFSLKEQN
jgi:hypothetical protein